MCTILHAALNPSAKISLDSSERNEMAALICFHILGNSNIIFSLFISFFCEEDVTNTNLKKGMNLCVHIGKGGKLVYICASLVLWQIRRAPHFKTSVCFLNIVSEIWLVVELKTLSSCMVVKINHFKGLQGVCVAHPCIIYTQSKKSLLSPP